MRLFGMILAGLWLTGIALIGIWVAMCEWQLYKARRRNERRAQAIADRWRTERPR